MRRGSPGEPLFDIEESSYTTCPRPNHNVTVGSSAWLPEVTDAHSTSPIPFTQALANNELNVYPSNCGCDNPGANL